MFRYRLAQLILVIVGVILVSCEEVREIPIEVRILRVGEDTDLECFPKDLNANSSGIRMHWERPPGTIVQIGSLMRLKNVQLEDSGNYTCKAVQVINSRLVSEDIIEELIIDPRNVNISAPLITITGLGMGDANDIQLTETQFLKLECGVSNWNESEYRTQWIKESTEEHYPLNTTLLIKSVTKDRDEGNYRCEVQHKEDESQIFNHRANVTITKPSITTIILPTENLNINGWIHRKCVPFKVADNTQLEKFSFRWVTPSGSIVSHNSVLQIPINDDSVIGTYECQYFSPTTYALYTSKINISSISMEETMKNHYDISIITYPQKLELNKRFSMRCQVSPTIKNLKYQWFRDGQSYRTVQTLIFPKFTKHDVGLYECLATGNNEDKIDIALRAESEQKITYFYHNKFELTEDSGSNIAMQLNEKTELHCEVNGLNDITGEDVEWFFNGKKIDSVALKLYQLNRFDQRSVSILTLLTSQLVNEGHYECQVGMVRKDATVILDIATGYIKMSPSEIKVNEGEPIEFHCTIDDLHNNCDRNMTWRFYNNERTINYTITNDRWNVTKSRIADQTGFVSLESANLSDSGFIECTANGMTATSRLIVEKKQTKFNITASPHDVTVRKNQLFEFECFGLSENGTPYGLPQVEFTNGSLVSEDSRFVITAIGSSRVKVTAPNGIDASEHLRIKCSVNEKATVISIDVQDTCPPYHRYCKNKQCLPIGKFCDGTVDCEDGSDEDEINCNVCEPVSTICQDVDGVKPLKRTISKNFVCDGENDCGNNFDELNCKDMDMKCSGMVFQCHDNVTIPRGYVCDGLSDCVSGEDEMNCMKPEIIKTSATRIKSKIGGQVKLQCEATAYPLPTVIWRFNWGCLPDESRMKIQTIKKNCKKVISTLVIDNFQPGDDAIYNCEALSSSNRIMSEDFQISIM